MSRLSKHSHTSVSSFPKPWLLTNISSVQSLSRVCLFATPCTAARRDSLSVTNSGRLLKLVSVESAMPSNHLVICLTNIIRL